MNQFYYVYVLLSEKDNKKYTGYTKNLKLRFEQYSNGEVESIKNRRLLKLIYFEGCLNQQDATQHEGYFKTHYGKMFIKKRLAKWFLQSSAC